MFRAALLLLFVATAVCSLDRLKASATPQEQVDAVIGLTQRLFGNQIAGKFNYSIIPQSQGKDVYEITTPEHDRVLIQGSSGVALASGLYEYMRYSCGLSVTWGDDGTGDNLDIPSPLPSVTGKKSVVAPVKWRYYMNVCTVSYSAVWWDWKRWEREIDWMALHGINLPLSFTGQEYVWAQTFKQLGCTEEDVQDFFSGPAFLAWNRMGNLQHWAGPLLPDWREGQMQLQKQILTRSRQFGMVPVLPGFAGHVPRAFQTLFPKSNITRNANWAGFNQTNSADFLVEPTDPLFAKVGKVFIDAQTQIYGTDHIYNADTYNEMRPKSNDPTYLGASSKGVLTALQEADPDAVWLMQGWLFTDTGFWKSPEIKAYLGSIPDDKMIILDLWSEEVPIWSKTSSYFGKPFIWCTLHNFGGRRSLYGPLDVIANGPLDAIAAKSTIIGTGITPEAIENNPIVYELATEVGWRDAKFNVSQWIQQYQISRYGGVSSNAASTWKTLYKSTYSHQGITLSPIEHVPNIKINSNEQPDATGIVSAWHSIIKASSDYKKINGPYNYDLVDITRQVLIDLFIDLHYLFRIHYQDWETNKTNTTIALKSIGDKLMDIIKDTDTILASDVNYLLGRWINNARNSGGTTTEEKDALEFNARNQITLWGPTGQINDYASKAWSGLYSDYYYGRWNIWYKTLLQAVKSGVPVDEDKYNKELSDFEIGWNHEKKSFPTTATGNPLDIAKSFEQKYSPSASLYEVKDNTDVSGNTLHGMWIKDVEQLMVMCNADPYCKGFNSKGETKTSTSNQVSSTGVKLYIKK